MAKRGHAPETSATSGSSAPPLQRSAPVPVARNVVRSSTFVSLYANDVQIHTSPWDMRIVLGEIADAEGGSSPSINVNQLGEVRISPQLAKKLVQIIYAQIQAYEQMFGQIPDIGIGID
jgi:hypothetical protein